MDRDREALRRRALSDDEDTATRARLEHLRIRTEEVDPAKSWPIITAEHGGIVHGWTLERDAIAFGAHWTRHPDTGRWAVRSLHAPLEPEAFVTVRKADGSYSRVWISRLEIWTNIPNPGLHGLIGQPPKGREADDPEDGPPTVPVVFKTFEQSWIEGTPEPYGKAHEITCEACRERTWFAHYLRGDAVDRKLAVYMAPAFAARYPHEIHETRGGNKRIRRVRRKVNQGQLFGGA